MNDRSLAIAILCSHLCVGDGVLPLEPREYSGLAVELGKRKLNPEDLLRFDRNDFLQTLELPASETDRLIRLFDRAASLSFEISRYESMGITLVTRADAAYPKRLTEKLKNTRPPLFYAAGDLKLADLPAIGYVGSRTVGDRDTAFTRAAVQKTVGRGYAVVSGGAKGCDSVAEEEALSSGGTAIAYLSDSMLRKLKKSASLQAVQQGRLLLLSVVKPDAGFNTGVAMMRNRYIYAQSEATLVIKADYNKGGTWNGAVENLKNHWALPLCWGHLSYPGNKALIEMGAYSVPDDWDGELQPFLEEQTRNAGEQISLF